MAQTVAEVPESEAAGKIKGVYDDIKSTLRTPVVGSLFRALAVYPDYLQVAWIGLKPNVQTVFFETRTDQLRAFAVQSLPLTSAPPAPEAALQSLDVFRYLNPKLLLVAATLKSASSGQQPRLTELTRDEKRQVAPGIPRDAQAVVSGDDSAASAEPSGLLDQMRSELGLPLVPDEYRALAQWPDYLSGAWAAVQRLMAAPEYSRFERQLRRSCEETILALPYRIDISPHVLRQSGLSEADLDGVQRVLNTYYRALPGLLAGGALLAVGAHGQEAAQRSPFPATIL